MWGYDDKQCYKFWLYFHDTQQYSHEIGSTNQIPNPNPYPNLLANYIHDCVPWKYNPNVRDFGHDAMMLCYTQKHFRENFRYPNVILTIKGKPTVKVIF